MEEIINIERKTKTNTTRTKTTNTKVNNERNK